MPYDITGHCHIAPSFLSHGVVFGIYHSSFVCPGCILKGSSFQLSLPPHQTGHPEVTLLFLHVYRLNALTLQSLPLQGVSRRHSPHIDADHGLSVSFPCLQDVFYPEMERAFCPSLSLGLHPLILPRTPTLTTSTQRSGVRMWLQSCG